jgi:hypothetical protein
VNELKDLHDFFGASVGAAAALIGLLFVAISVAPEKIFGSAADIDRRLNAERAFTALTNVFFVSLAVLMPRDTLPVIAVVAILAMSQIVRAGMVAFRRRPELKTLLHVGLISLGIYVLELVTSRGIATRNVPADKLIYIVLGLYAYALLTSWGLLGASDSARKT